MKAKSEKLVNKAESPELDQSSFSLSAFGFKLRVGYDGKRAANNLTGLGNYSRSLIEHLATQFPENQYFIYTPKIKAEIEKLPLFAQKNINLALPTKSKFKLFWRSFSIKNQLKKDKIDLFHGLSHEIPFGINQTGVKSVVTIHDLIFLRYPKYYKLIDRIIYKFKSKYACKNADKIIAISEKTKDDIIEFYKINPSKIEVIYQSCDDSFKTTASETTKTAIRNKYNLPKFFLLNVGTIEPRKNLLLIIKALAQTNTKIPLVVIGKAKPYLNLVKNEITKNQLQDRVIFLQDVLFTDLPVIYQLSKIFIYPSFYEGFGIPIIEALYSGTPVIATTGSCLEEAGGPNSIYLHPADADTLAQKIDLLVNNHQICNQMIVAGLDFVKKFNTKDISNQLINYYKNVLGLS